MNYIVFNIEDIASPRACGLCRWLKEGIFLLFQHHRLALHRGELCRCRQVTWRGRRHWYRPSTFPLKSGTRIELYWWLTTILGLHVTIHNTELALLRRLLEVMHMGIVYGEALRLIVVWHVRSPARGWSRGVTWSWRVAPELGSLRIRWGRQNFNCPGRGLYFDLNCKVLNRPGRSNLIYSEDGTANQNVGCSTE